MAKTLDEIVYVAHIRDFILRQQIPNVEAETQYGILVVSAPDRSILIDILTSVAREKEFKGDFGIHIVGTTKAVVWHVDAE